MIQFLEQSQEKAKLVESQLLNKQNELAQKLETNDGKQLIPKYKQQTIHEITELFNNRDF